MGKTLKVRTDDAGAPMLGAGFWKQGERVSGVIERVRDTKYGPAYTLKLVTPVTLDGEACERVEVGNLAGFRMCLQALHERGFPSVLPRGTQLYIECYEIEPAKAEGMSPMPRFAVEATLP